QERQVALAVGAIVLVEPAELAVEAFGEPSGVRHKAGELHEEAVPPGRGWRFGKDRADVKIDHRGRTALGARADGPLDLLADQVLAERRQEVTCPASESQEWRVRSLEAHRI